MTNSLKPNEYKCAHCSGVFVKGRSDEDANAESEKYFGVKSASDRDDFAIVCDDCFNKMHPKDNPKLIEDLREEDAVADVELEREAQMDDYDRGLEETNRINY